MTVGFFEDGTPGEVFIGSSKTGGDVEAIARDAGVTISLALQHGVGIEAIQHAVTRDSHGAPASISVRRLMRSATCAGNSRRENTNDDYS